MADRVAMTPEQVSAHDLRNVCIHEAAHVVVARQFGVQAHAYVHPTGATDTMFDKAWTGQCFFGRMPERQARIVALAGEVAVLVSQEAEDGEEYTAMVIDDLFSDDRDYMSETDWRCAGEYALEDLEECLSLVRQHWPAIEQAADEMAEQGRRFAGELEQWAEGKRGT